MNQFQVVTLPVASLEVCDRTRVRDRIPQAGSEIVGEYAEAYQCGLITEPLDVFREKGTERYIVADGEHRLLALRRARIEKAECRLHEGEELDALRYAAQCNQKHGLRRTKADIYHTFCRIMETKLKQEFRTDRDLSDLLGVSVRTIQRYRADWRETEGGDGLEVAGKREARQRAEKHPGRPKDMTSVISEGQEHHPGMGNMTGVMSGNSGASPPAPESSPDDSDEPSLGGVSDEDIPERLDDHELAEEMERESREYQESIQKVMEADDILSAAHAEIKRQAAEIAVLKSSRDGYMNGKTAVVDMLKAEQRKTERQSKLIDRLREEIEQLKATSPRDTEALQEQVDRLTAENEKLRERIAIMEESA